MLSLSQLSLMQSASTLTCSNIASNVFVNQTSDVDANYSKALVLIQV